MLWGLGDENTHRQVWKILLSLLFASPVRPSQHNLQKREADGTDAEEAQQWGGSGGLSSEEAQS